MGTVLVIALSGARATVVDELIGQGKLIEFGEPGVYPQSWSEVRNGVEFRRHTGRHFKARRLVMAPALKPEK